MENSEREISDKQVLKIKCAKRYLLLGTIITFALFVALTMYLGKINFFNGLKTTLDVCLFYVYLVIFAFLIPPISYSIGCLIINSSSSLQTPQYELAKSKVEIRFNLTPEQRELIMKDFGYWQTHNKYGTERDIRDWIGDIIFNKIAELGDSK